MKLTAASQRKSKDLTWTRDRIRCLGLPGWYKLLPVFTFSLLLQTHLTNKCSPVSQWWTRITATCPVENCSYRLIHSSSVDFLVQYVSNRQFPRRAEMVETFLCNCWLTVTAVNPSGSSYKLFRPHLYSFIDTQKIDCTVLCPFEDPSSQKCVLHILTLMFEQSLSLEGCFFTFISCSTHISVSEITTSLDASHVRNMQLTQVWLQFH